MSRRATCGCTHDVSTHFDGGACLASLCDCPSYVHEDSERAPVTERAAELPAPAMPLPVTHGWFGFGPFPSPPPPPKPHVDASCPCIHCIDWTYRGLT